MNWRVLRTGLGAGVVALVCTALVQGLLPFRDTLGYKEAPEEATVLSILDRALTETGLYLVPGHSPPDSLFRARYEAGPLFRIHSLRRGAGGPPHVVISMLAVFLAPLVPAWVLFLLCRSGRPSFARRVTLVFLFGVFLALSGHIQLWGTELYPFSYALLLTFDALFTWMVVGLVLAWRISPESVGPGGD
jgi:hypothetical protein